MPHGRRYREGTCPVPEAGSQPQPRPSCPQAVAGLGEAVQGKHGQQIRDEGGAGAPHDARQVEWSANTTAV